MSEFIRCPCQVLSKSVFYLKRKRAYHMISSQIINIDINIYQHISTLYYIVFICSPLSGCSRCLCRGSWMPPRRAAALQQALARLLTQGMRVTGRKQCQQCVLLTLDSNTADSEMQKDFWTFLAYAQIKTDGAMQLLCRGIWWRKHVDGMCCRQVITQGLFA